MCDRPSLRTAAEMAELLHLKVGTWRDLARRRRFPRYSVGHAVRWDEGEILRLLRDEP